jgi:hypothetical protein
VAHDDERTRAVGAVPFVLVDKLDAWASGHLDVAEAGMLYALHPQLMPPRLAAHRHRRRGPAARWPAEPRFAATLETFAGLRARLDEFLATLTAEEAEAFGAALLDEERARSLLRQLLASCGLESGRPPA